MFGRTAARVAALMSVFGATTGWQPIRAAQNDGDLKIVILSGDGLTNNLKKRVSTTPIVEVRDRNNKPVAGATVAFLLPANGPGATFANGSRLLTAVTGPNGQAAASAMQANGVAGSF